MNDNQFMGLQTPASYLLLEIRVLVVPKLDASLSVEGPSLDVFEMLLVLSAPETMAIELGSGTSPCGRGVLPRSL